MESNTISYQSLLEKFDETKKQLGEAEETIRRITGRDPDQFVVTGPGIVRWKNSVQIPGRPFPERKRPFQYAPRHQVEEEAPPVDEDSPDEDGTPAKKPTLQSTVIATPKDVKSRRDTIQEQNVDSKVTARNRRMLGMILGTLQRFQKDEKKRKQQETKRAEIEQKVEAAAEHEKEQIKKEKEELFVTRKEKQVQLRCLEKKLEIAEIHQVWKSSQEKVLNFIQTKAKPPLFFLPATHNEKSLKCLEESRKKISDEIQTHDEKLEKDLLEIEEWYKKDNFPSDKENIGPPEGVPVQELPSMEQEQAQEPVAGPEEESTVVMENTEDRTNDDDNDKALETLADQEFEPIYDE